MEHKQALLFIWRQLQALTPAQRRLLSQFMQYEGEELTRRKIAQIVGKPYLMRYDIKMLDALEEAGFLGVRKTSMAYEFGKPTDYKGRNITMATRYYTYRLDASTADYIREIGRLRKAQREQKKPGLLQRIMGR